MISPFLQEGFKPHVEWFSRGDLVIDAGTTHTVLASRQNGFLLRCPTRVALNEERSGKGGKGEVRLSMAAYGSGALRWDDSWPETVRMVSPMDHGQVAERAAMDMLLRAMYRQVRGGQPPLWQGRGLGGLLVDPGQNMEQQYLLFELTQPLAGGTVKPLSIPLAAARGAGWEIQAPRGRMVIDLGGGRTTLGVISMGQLVHHHSRPVGGEDLDRALAAYIESAYHIPVELSFAERVKKEIGSLYPQEKPLQTVLQGSPGPGGQGKKFLLDDNEVRDALLDAFEPVVGAIQQGFSGLDPEICRDISTDGVMLVGGGALLAGTAQYLSERFGLPFYLSADPLNILVKGAMALLNESSGKES
ncbi:MAG: rod shape-determining protein [Deltaproteobacteria bacterium]|nr:rod shape-determining protein [Deltaproteobacteria bacterium]MDH4122002.1 rod shape-determining protein [Deltaproteobacteria bacterium]